MIFFLIGYLFDDGNDRHNQKSNHDNHNQADNHRVIWNN